MQELIQHGYMLKTQIADLSAQLKDINQKIADATEFKNGSKTGHISTPDINVKVVKRENVRWDQKKLLEIKEHFPTFNMYFKPEYKPVARALKQSNEPELLKAVDWCKSVSEGAPTVTYELIKEEV